MHESCTVDTVIQYPEIEMANEGRLDAIKSRVIVVLLQYVFTEKHWREKVGIPVSLSHSRISALIIADDEWRTLNLFTLTVRSARIRFVFRLRIRPHEVISQHADVEVRITVSGMLGSNPQIKPLLWGTNG